MTTQATSLLPRAVPALLALALPAGAPARAEDLATLPAERLVTLPEYVVEGVSPSESVNPLARPAGPLFGDGRNLLDTPRAVGVFTEAFLERFDIHDVRRLGAFAAGAATPSRFGNLTTPNIRGDVAETYWGGQRRAANLFGVAPSFNAIEAVEVVRGPATVVLGPGAYPGGFVAYEPKAPVLGHEATTAWTRLGAWHPGGGSHAAVTLGLDHQRPLSPTAALRVSWEGADSDTFFGRSRPAARDDHQDLYAALRWEPEPGLSVDANAQVSWQAQTQLLGVNRPSDTLVREGRYFTGTAPDIGGPWTGAWFLTPTGTTTLADDDLFLSARDYSNAVITLAQVVVADRRRQDFEVVQRVMVEHVDRRRFHEDEYAELARQFTVDLRTEFRHAFALAGLPSESVAGLALRYEERETYVNYFNEYFFTWDITDGRPSYDFRADYPLTVFPGTPGPRGLEFFGAAAGSPETTYSQLFTPGVFLQHEIELARGLRLFWGARGDVHFADARDPLPLPGQPRWRDEHSFTQGGGHASLTWRPVEAWSTYFTWSRSAAVNVSVSGGGLFLFNGAFDPNDFANRSDLLEAGLRGALLGNRLYVAATGYHQTRTRTEFRGGKADLDLEGAELELTWQPRPEGFATLAVTWFDGRYDASAPFQSGGRSIHDLYAPGTGPGGLGTGAGWEPFPGARQVPVGDWRLTGESRWTVVAGGGWRPDRGPGIVGDLTWRSAQPGNLDREWSIPSQLTANLGLAWASEGWSANLWIRNVLDARNWVHNGDTFMNNLLVSRELPRRLELEITRRW